MRILSLFTSILLVFGMVFMPIPSNADLSIGISITANVPPPILPIYVQPASPASHYIWTPGYWAWDSFFQDYYWVPGTWVRPAQPGYLWTPGYWGWSNGVYVYNEGYWGPHIGFYGGVNYGHGYRGVGNTSFNGGPKGIKVQPTADEQVAMKEKHLPPTAEQKTQVVDARKNPALRASHNHGKPAIAATRKAGVFHGKGVVAAQNKPTYKNTARSAKHATSSKHAALTKHANATKHSKALTHTTHKPAVKKHVVKKVKPKIVPQTESKPNSNN